MRQLKSREFSSARQLDVTLGGIGTNRFHTKNQQKILDVFKNVFINVPKVEEVTKCLQGKAPEEVLLWALVTIIFHDKSVLFLLSPLS